jgi:hypothetical protein
MMNEDLGSELLKLMEADCVYITQDQMIAFISDPKRVVKFHEFACRVGPVHTKVKGKNGREKSHLTAFVWRESENRKTVETLELWAETHGLQVQRGKCGGVQLYKYDPLASQTIEGRQVIDKFRQAMQANGVPYSGEIIPDGFGHYFDVDGDEPGCLNGSYSLGLGDRPYGWIESSKTGLSMCWIYTREDGKVSQHTNKKEGG